MVLPTVIRSFVPSFLLLFIFFFGLEKVLVFRRTSSVLVTSRTPKESICALDIVRCVCAGQCAIPIAGFRVVAINHTLDTWENIQNNNNAYKDALSFSGGA